MDISTLPTPELLALLIGEEEASALYKGALVPLMLEHAEADGPTAKLSAARELVERALAEDLEDRDILCCPQLVRKYLHIHFAGRTHESFAVLYLDAQHRMIAFEDLFRGTLTQTAVYPREVALRALHFNAAAVIFAHNHPSGVAEPSRADETLTKTLKESLDLLDVHVLDHFVVAGTNVVSLAERGMV